MAFIFFIKFYEIFFVDFFCFRNPQSTQFCAKLGIKDLNEMLCSLSADGIGTPYYMNAKNNPENVLKSKILEKKEVTLMKIEILSF